MKISAQIKNGRALSVLLFVIQTVVIGQIFKNGIPVLQPDTQR